MSKDVINSFSNISKNAGRVLTNVEITPYLHAADLDLSRKTTKDPVNVVIESVRHSSSIGLSSFVSRFLRLRLQNSPALILIDGLDELTIQEIRAVVYWLHDLTPI